MQESFVFLNGNFVPVSEALLSVYDIGVLRGYGVYEGITTYGIKPFRLKDHLDRLRSSSSFLNLSIPYSDSEIEDIISKLVSKNGFAKTNLRILLTGGNTHSGIEYDKSKPTFFILGEEFKALPDSFYSEGCTLMTYDHQRMYPEYKTTNYITATNLQNTRKEKKALEILFHNKGKVLEAATSNFFIVKDGVCITADKNILLGITRKVALECAHSLGIKVEEREVTLDEMWNADEAFISATYKEIVPIVSIDGKTIGSGKVGEVTIKIMKGFAESTRV